MNPHLLCGAIALAAIALPTHAGIEETLLDFEDLVAGDLYDAGDFFTTGGVMVSYTGGGSDAVFVTDENNTGGTGNALEFLEDSSVRFDFDEPAFMISLQFAYGSGSMLLELNGIEYLVDHPDDLDAQIGFPGHVSVSQGSFGVSVGEISFTGPYDSFQIGGEELRIDNVRFLTVPGPAGLAMFAGLAVRRRRRSRSA